MAKPRRAIKRNSIRAPNKLKIWWGKGERNEVFIMNFKEIHSNTEFLSTYRRARACSCRNKIKKCIYRKVALTYCSSHFWRFPFFASGRYTCTAPLTRKRNLSHFLEVCQKIFNCLILTLTNTLYGYIIKIPRKGIRSD